MLTSDGQHNPRFRCVACCTPARGGLVFRWHTTPRPHHALAHTPRDLMTNRSEPISMRRSSYQLQLGVLTPARWCHLALSTMRGAYDVRLGVRVLPYSS